MIARMCELLRPFFACRLCWRITLAVFALILAVEAVILVPSSRRFEQDERKILADQAQLLVEPALARTHALGANPELDDLSGRYGLRGIALYAADGARLATVGDAPPNAAGDLETHARVRMDPDREATLLIAWRSSGMPGARVAVRSDATRIAPRLRAYQLRIAGLVLIIVLVVTAGTMVVVDAAVLRPVLRLRESSLRSGVDPAIADRFRVPTRRRDEMGELIEAHNALLARVSASARYLASHDPLTGLANRGALAAHLDRECGAGGATLLLVNLIGFRAINAGYGTQAGDRLVRELAERLRGLSGREDFVAHLGADRLAFACRGVLPPADASTLAEQFVRALARPFDLGGGASVSPSVRVGIAQSGPQACDGQALLAQADLALARTYRADDVKFQFFSPALAAEARTRQALSRDLERALQRGELSFALQPKFRLAAARPLQLAGAEVLLRWHHAERGAVGPAEFIPIAEASGLIALIGDQLLDSVCALAADWRARLGCRLRFAVNLSAQQFAQPDLLERSTASIARAGIAPEAIEFEITETAAMRDVQRTARTLAAMRKLGLRVSIDDFGTGYSSLNYLRRFAVDAIKIDKSFVDDIGRDRNAEAICDAILRLGQSLGTRVIAEGVENEAQAAFLLRRRCDEVQGFLFGRALPAAEFERLYLRERVAA